jgi:hypothetical protein
MQPFTLPAMYFFSFNLHMQVNGLKIYKYMALCRFMELFKFLFKKIKIFGKLRF